MNEPKEEEPAPHSIFRWAGSKKPILPHLLRRAPRSYKRYFEPFVGSGALLFALAPAKSVVNDSNAELINAYRELAKQPARLANSARAIATDNDTYLSVRELKPEALTPYRRAVRFTYLNRNCFNGVYRLNRDGLFNVPKGIRPGRFPSNDEFRQVATVLKRATLTAVDFERSISSASDGDFVYLDPPYSTSERFRGEYGRRFGEADLNRLIAAVRKLDARGVMFLVSYLDNPKLRDELRRFRVRTVQNPRRLASKVAARTTAKELLISNY